MSSRRAPTAPGSHRTLDPRAQSLDDAWEKIGGNFGTATEKLSTGPDGLARG